MREIDVKPIQLCINFKRERVNDYTVIELIHLLDL